MTYLPLNNKARASYARAATAAMKKIGDKFEMIAVRGFSGVLIGAIVAGRLNKNLVIVRKDEETSHGDSIEYDALRPASYLGEYEYPPPSYDLPVLRFVIVDDFVCTGKTVRKIIEDLVSKLPYHQIDVVALYVYHDKRLYAHTEILEHINYRSDYLCKVKAVKLPNGNVRMYSATDPLLHKKLAEIHDWMKNSDRG